MKLQRSIISLLAWLFFSSQTEAITLPELIDYGRQNDSKYLSEKAQQLAELEKLPQAKSFLYPNLSANFSEAYTDETLFAPDLPFVTQGSADYRSQSYGLRFRQALFNKEAMANYRQGKFAAALAQIELKIIENNVILRVAKAYFDVLKAQSEVELADSNVTFTLENYTLTQQQLELSLINQAENQQARARWLLAVADSQIAYNNLDNSLVEIERLTGTPLLPIDFLNEDYINVAPLTLDEESLLESNLQYLKQEVILEASKNSVSIQKAKRYPTIEFVIDHNINNTDGSLSGPASEREDTRALLQLSVPLFEGGRVRSLIRAEKHKFNSAEYALLETKKRILQDNKSFLAQLSALKLRLAALEGSVEASNFVLSERRNMFLEGLGRNVFVLDAQKEYFDASRLQRLALYNQQYLNNIGYLDAFLDTQ